MEELTDEERRAIAGLKRLAKRWPDTLWIFCGNGDIAVLRKGPNGEHVMTNDDRGVVDQDYVVASVDGIDNDGGGW